VQARTQLLFDFHVEAIDTAVLQLQLTAEASGLLLDPEAGSYYLMDLATDRLAPLLEALSVARGKGAAVLTRGDFFGEISVLTDTAPAADVIAATVLRVRTATSTPNEYRIAK